MTGAPGFDDARSFKAIWHAQLFALTVHLYDRGVFTWPQWSAALGHQLEQQPPEARLAQDQSEDSYYLAWLAALMDCLAGKQLTDEPLCLGIPFPVPPSPHVISLSDLSFMSTTRLQVILLGSMFRLFSQ